MVDIDHCWTLSRVPNTFELPEFQLRNDKEFISIGRKVDDNDRGKKICTGANVSRDHLMLKR